MNGKIIALCAAEFEPKDGDIYLDDTIDHALRLKFIKDYEAEGIDFKNTFLSKEINKIKECGSL